LLCLEAEGKKPSHKHLHQDIYTGTRPSGQVVSYVNLMALWVVLQNYLGLQWLSSVPAPVQVGRRSLEPPWGRMSPKLTRRTLISAGCQHGQWEREVLK